MFVGLCAAPSQHLKLDIFARCRLSRSKVGGQASQVTGLQCFFMSAACCAICLQWSITLQHGMHLEVFKCAPGRRWSP